jgi:hypothetical protein
MATTIVIDPTNRPSITVLVNLVTQCVMLENLGGTPQVAALANARYNFLRAMEIWPASMLVAAAIVGNTSAFSATTIGALSQSNAP